MMHRNRKDDIEWSRLFFAGLAILLGTLFAGLTIAAIWSGNESAALCFGALFAICLLITFAER